MALINTLLFIIFLYKTNLMGKDPCTLKGNCGGFEFFDTLKFTNNLLQPLFSNRNSQFKLEKILKTYSSKRTLFYWLPRPSKRAKAWGMH